MPYLPRQFTYSEDLYKYAGAYNSKPDLWKAINKARRRGLKTYFIPTVNLYYLYTAKRTYTKNKRYKRKYNKLKK